MTCPWPVHQSPPVKFRLLFIHLLPSLTGMVRTLLRHPLFGLQLLAVRMRFFITRRLNQPVSTPDGFLIETTGELISYWSFFIEREGCVPEWLEALARQSKPLILDVGANVGQSARRFREAFPKSAIHCFASRISRSAL